jgi:hypothetical protein
MLNSKWEEGKISSRNLNESLLWVRRERATIRSRDDDDDEEEKGNH